MNISPKINNLNFKGYDAAPIKNIYLDSMYCAPIRDEMEQISKSENFKIRYLVDNQQWGQDHKTIIEKDGKACVLADGLVSYECQSQFKNRGMITQRSLDYIAGGNSFIGKKPDGKKFLLAGKNEILTRNFEPVSKLYGIDEENIFLIPQQDFHLDMFMRPIGYPYILVNDENLVFKQISKLKGNSEDISRLRGEAIYHYNDCKWRPDTKKTIEKLKSCGFIPIPVAGVYSEGINFMNGIVNKKPNGKMTYITNSTKCRSRIHSSIEEIFREELLGKVPLIDKIYFIKGQEKSNHYSERYDNYMMNTLSQLSGGIHCMSVEEPDFSSWA